jgi:acetoacetyl-CoA synthetase
MEEHQQGEIMWTPPATPSEASVVGRYLRFLRERHGLQFGDYFELHRWSTSDLEAFWASIWEFFEIKASTPYEEVLSSREMPGAKWFTGSQLNYAEHMLGTDEDTHTTAVIGSSQSRALLELTFGDLREQVAAARTGLLALGVQAGDRVVGYIPNIPETLVAFLATTSIGAIWATCPPEFGPRSTIDRFAMLDPKVLFAVSGYRYGEKDIDRRAEVAELRAAIPTLEHVVHVPYRGGEADALPDTVPWERLLAERGPLEFAQVPFDHPLWVLFSSGTTGLPKAIVHGHGGITVENHKNHGISWDLQAGGRLMWFTTTAWMMWNALAGALMRRSSIVMLDGNPQFPDIAAQWRLAEQLRPTMMGASPAFIMGCRKAGINLREFDLSSLRQLAVAGSPLPPEGFDWIYEQVGSDVYLSCGSGGTDLCTGIVQGNLMLPVYRGEMSGAELGVDVAAFNALGEPVIGELGELVIRQPMPSMPVKFWNDPGGARLHAAYFEEFPGVWRHGDWISFSERGSCIITGRSDATLNRGGVRLGTGEFYPVVEDMPEVQDSLVVHLEDGGGGPGELILFVVPAEGVVFDEDLRKRIALELRGALSPRHVPDTIAAVPAIPRTLTSKKLELPVKRILLGATAADVASRDALADPGALDAFVDFAAGRT